jgi:chemotaxis protein MotA
MAMPKLAILAMTGGKTPEVTTARIQMVKLSEKARRDGLLGLEEDVQQIEDEFARKGLQLVVDGADSDLVRAVLQSETDGMSSRHRANAQTFVQAGGFAPTLGILGTVLSLVHVLENLDNPSTLGHSIAGAFCATLYGVGIANLVFLPIGNKLKALSAAELQYREMLLEAILSIQAGDNPRMLAETLETFLAPAERKAAAEAEAAASGGAGQAEERKAA